MHNDNDGMEGVFVRLSILFVVPFMVLDIDWLSFCSWCFVLEFSHT